MGGGRRNPLPREPTLKVVEALLTAPPLLPTWVPTSRTVWYTLERVTSLRVPPPCPPPERLTLESLPYLLLPPWILIQMEHITISSITNKESSKIKGKKIINLDVQLYIRQSIPVP